MPLPLPPPLSLMRQPQLSAGAKLALALLSACVALPWSAVQVTGNVLPGEYFLLHRHSGRYLRGDFALDDLSAEARVRWQLHPADGGSGQFFLRHVGSGQFLGVSGGGEDLVSLGAAEDAETWSIFRVCHGSSVAVVDRRGFALVMDDASAKARLLPGGGAGVAGARAGLWSLLRPCPHEEPGASMWGMGEQGCWPVGSQWSNMSEDCCSVQLHGRRGNQACFDVSFTFERCCPEAQEQEEAPPSMTPQILCSGERLEGHDRSVLMTDYDGNKRWVKSMKLVTETPFDFGRDDSTAEALLGVRPRLLHVVEGLPSCAGPVLLDEAQGLLPDVELHAVVAFRSLHDAMLRAARDSAALLPELTHDIHYLPVFPFLLMMLHRLTRDDGYLGCLAKTVTHLGRLPAWQRNAGYDFVLALGYDRPWERRQAKAWSDQSYNLHEYDPRFANVLVLATHDAFFGERGSLFHPSQGGAAYRGLTHVVVPLPFTLNCTLWRRAAASRRAAAVAALRGRGLREEQRQAPGLAAPWPPPPPPPPLRRRPRFRVSFVGSVNGASRDLIRRAVERLQANASFPLPGDALAVRFVYDDEGRAELAQRPGDMLRAWFGDRVASFEELLLESQFCLVLPGDVSDLATRFLHALSVACTPVLVGGPAQTIPLPFAEFVGYHRFARLATVSNVDDGVALLEGLLSENEEVSRAATAAASAGVEAIAGLFTAHEGCGWPSGEPFVRLLARALEARARIWTHIRRYV